MAPLNIAPLTRAAFADQAQAWGSAVGVEVTVEFSGDLVGDASMDSWWTILRNHHQAVLEVNTAVLQLPRQAQLTLLGHEIGHAAKPPWAQLSITAVFFAVTIPAMVSLAAALFTSWPPGGVLLPAVALLIVTVVLMPAYFWAARRSEFAADAWAMRTYDLPYTTSYHAQLLDVGLGDRTSDKQGWLDRLTRSHPPPEQRAAGCQTRGRQPNRSGG